MTRGASGPEHGRPDAGQRAAGLERGQEPGNVGVAPHPSGLVPTQRVDGAYLSSDCVDVAQVVHHRLLEGSSDAEAGDIQRVGQREQVVGVPRLERHVDGVDPQGVDPGVVHGR